MDHRRLIRIDNLFAPALWIVKKIKSIHPAKIEKQDQFIVVKFFGLGSITRIAAVSENLNLDKTAITFVTLDHNKPIVQELGFNCIPIKTKSLSFIGSIIGTFFKIWKRKDAVVLDMERTANLSGIYSVVASIGKARKSFSINETNHAYEVSLKNKMATQAIAEMFGKELQKMDGPSQKDKVTTKKVVVNINAGDYLPQRRFPPEKFVELIRELSHEFPDFNFVLTGSKKELNRVSDFEQLLQDELSDSGKITNVAGQHDLTGFIQLIKTAQLVITNDSGPLHLAHYHGVKSVSIWGPTAAKLVGYPDSKQMLNLTASKNCSPCFIHPKSKVAENCNGAVTCFQEMEVKEMAIRIKDFILEA